MKKFITLLFLMGIFAFQMNAQTFTVFSVQGTVDSLDQRGRVKSQIQKNLEVDSATCIKVNENGRIVLIDKKNQRLYTINKPVQGPLIKLIYQKECSIKNLSKQYFTYLLKRMQKSNRYQTAANYMGCTINVYRGNDSVAHDSLVIDSTLYREMCNDSIE